MRQRPRKPAEALAATTKFCRGCQTIKSKEEFGINRKTIDGRMYDCRECTRKASRERYSTHRDEMRRQAAKRSRDWRKNNPEGAARALARFAATEHGKLNRWSCGAAARYRKTEVRRGDGRIRIVLGGSVTPKQLRELWVKQDGKCALTGRQMIFRNGKQDLDSISVDRIDPKKGYELGNIRLVIYQANCARLFGTDERLRDFCRWVLACPTT